MVSVRPSILSPPSVSSLPYMSQILSLLSLTPSLFAPLPLSFLLVSSILPVLKVLIIAAIGLAFAHPAVGILHSHARHALSKLVFSIFLPAIIFVNLGESINVKKLLEWWFIPVNVILSSLIGCSIGVAVGRITKTPPQFSRVVFILTGIGNMGNMPLVLISAVCSDSRNPFGGSCEKMGTAYVSLGMWMAAFIMWGFAYNALAPPEDWLPGYRRLPDHGITHVSTQDTKKFHPPPTVSASQPDIVLSENNNSPENINFLGTNVSVGNSYALQNNRVLGNNSAPENGGVAGDSSMTTPLLQRASGSFRKASAAVLVAHARFHYWMTTLHIYDILRPPVLAAFLAMFMGMIPVLDRIMFSAEGEFRFLTDAIKILGQAMIPCILLVLGGNLVGGPGSSELPVSTTVILVITRLLVVPCVGISVVLTADYLGFIPPDPLFKFVLFLQHSMPSSIQIGTACSLRGFGEKEVSAILFYQHLACVVSMTFFLFIFFYLLFGV